MEQGPESAHPVTWLPRFLSKFEERPGPLPTPCWIWTACIQFERAIFQAPGRKKVYAHRWAWEQYYGKTIPAWADLHHVCEVKHCVNPRHVRPLTTVEHKAAHENRNASKTSCQNGHPFSKANTYTWTDADGGIHRRCRICTRATWNRMYQRGTWGKRKS